MVGGGVERGGDSGGGVERGGEGESVSYTGRASWGQLGWWGAGKLRKELIPQ